MSFFGNKGVFYILLKTTRWICANFFFFFSGFRRKHLFITTCIKSNAPSLKKQSICTK